MNCEEDKNSVVYGIIDESFWSEHEHLSLELKAFLAYLVSNIRVNIAGLYKVTLNVMATELGIPKRKIEKLLVQTEKIKFAFYDKNTQWVWIRTLARRNLRGVSKQQITGVMNILEGCKSVELFTQFKDYYLGFFKNLGVNLDTLPIPSIEGVIPITDSDSDSNSITTLVPQKDLQDVLDHLNKKAKKHFQSVEANFKFIRGRIKEGNPLKLLKAVVDVKCEDWNHAPDEYKNEKDMRPYLRPETLFNPTKFQTYLQNALRYLEQIKQIKKTVPESTPEKPIPKEQAEREKQAILLKTRQLREKWGKKWFHHWEEK